MAISRRKPLTVWARVSVQKAGLAQATGAEERLPVSKFMRARVVRDAKSIIARSLRASMP